MTADVVPVRVSDEDCCEWRQSRRISLQGLVCGLREIRSRTRVNADELMAVLGNHEVVFREFEAGQRVDATGHDLDDATRCKRMTRHSVFGERCCQCDGMIEIGIPAAPKVLICLCGVAIIQGEFAEMKVNFAQPRRMRRFVSVLCAPRELLMRSLSL